MWRFLDVPVRLGAITLLAIGVTLAGEAAAGGPNESIQVCIQPHGSKIRLVNARQSCRSWERRLQWNVRGPQGEAGPPGPPGAAGPPGTSGVMQLVDHAGATVGALVGCCDVVLDADGTKVLLPVLADGFAQTPRLFYFESPDCSGPPLLPQNGVFSHAIVEGATAYFATDFRSRPIQSQAYQGDCYPMTYRRPTGPASAIDLSRFVPPFSVR
jgi:hypothetical protein